MVTSRLPPDAAVDDGSCPPLLASALASGSALAVAAAVRHSRLLVPVVAAPTADADEGCEFGDPMASVTFTSGDGRSALLAFSSLSQLLAWDANARPLPRGGADIAATALRGGLDAVIVDVAAEHRTALQGSDLRIAAGID